MSKCASHARWKVLALNFKHPLRALRDKGRLGVLNYKRAELARLVDHLNAREVLAGHPYLEVIPLGDRDQFR